MHHMQRAQVLRHVGSGAAKSASLKKLQRASIRKTSRIPLTVTLPEPGWMQAMLLFCCDDLALVVHMCREAQERCPRWWVPAHERRRGGKLILIPLGPDPRQWIIKRGIPRSSPRGVDVIMYTVEYLPPWPLIRWEWHHHRGTFETSKPRKKFLSIAPGFFL